MLSLSIQVFLRRCGWEIRRYRPKNSVWAGLATMLAHHRVEVVLDVGANIGRYATSLRGAGYKGQIVSFDPLPQALERLHSLARRDPLWTIMPIALSDCAGEAELNISPGSGAFSSFLPSVEGGVRFSGRTRAKLARLDSLAIPTTRSFLKIDAQGYEDRVLRGAQGIISDVLGLQIELNVAPMYEGQALFEEGYRQIVTLGFEPWAFYPAYSESATGRMTGVDAIFFRGAPKG